MSSPIPSPPGPFRRMPPAVFAPIFGLFGLGLAWRRAADMLEIGTAAGDFILGLTSLLYLFGTVSYGVKFMLRPGVLTEDLRSLPGRAGLAGMSLGGMLFAASLIPFAPGPAEAVLLAALGLHALLVVLVLGALLGGPAEARRVTPVWHLFFVGFIIAPVAGVPLGHVAAARAILFASMAMAVAIWAMSAAQMLRRAAPAPLRPTLAIHLSPAALLGTVSYLLGYPALGQGFAILSILILAGLLAALPWLIRAGFSPLWGAFTFPLAAFSVLMQIVAAAGGGEAYRVLGALSLVAGTLVIPYIAYRVVRLWASGQLAAKTNAAVA